MNATDDVVDLHQALLEAEVRVSRLRAERDEAIRVAIRDGATAYRLAHELGLSQMQVGRIAKAD